MSLRWSHGGNKWMRTGLPIQTWLRNVGDQIRRAGPPLGAMALLTTAAVVGIAGLSRVTGAPIANLVRDPAVVNDAPVYNGILSNVGILLWTAAGALCFFVMALAKRAGRIDLVRFFLCSGLFSTLLALDDLFMLHETVGPALTELPEKVLSIAYPLAILVYLAVFARVILQTEWMILFAALACLGISETMDWFMRYSSVETIVEDGLKFAGILCWLDYFARTAMTMCAQAVDCGNLTRPDNEPAHSWQLPRGGLTAHPKK